MAEEGKIKGAIDFLLAPESRQDVARLFPVQLVSPTGVEITGQISLGSETGPDTITPVLSSPLSLSQRQTGGVFSGTGRNMLGLMNFRV